MSVQYIFSIAGVFAVAHITASILTILTVHWIQNHYSMSTLPAGTLAILASILYSKGRMPNLLNKTAPEAVTLSPV